MKQTKNTGSKIKFWLAAITWLAAAISTVVLYNKKIKWTETEDKIKEKLDNTKEKSKELLWKTKEFIKENANKETIKEKCSNLKECVIDKLEKLKNKNKKICCGKCCSKK